MRRPLGLALIVFACAPAAAPAATVSGKLAGGAGYTVLAMSASGRTASVRVPASGAFSLKLAGSASTLQLVKPNGAYFGPVVLGKAGKKAIVRLSARGGKLGSISLKAAYAVAKAPKKAVSRGGAVATKNGAPLGAGRLGFVKLKGHKARIASAGDDQVGGDPDGDGIPSAFDADDNGNGTMDGVDPQTARASTAGLFSDVQVMMSRAINANAGAGLSGAAIDDFVKNNTSLDFYLDNHSTRGVTVSAVDVDCGTLVYCRPGDGTALMGDGGNSPTGVQNQRWATYDTNHDGFPDVPLNTNGGGSEIHSIEIRPNVTTADIHAGDLYQVRYTTPGGVISVPTALSLLFASSPALASYDGGAGTVPVTYPAVNGGPGSDQNPLHMSSDKLTVTFWRPQRSGLGGEAPYMDMGHLRYGIAMSGGNHELQCADRYSGLSSTLTTGGSVSDAVYNALFPLQDTADDAAPDKANTLKFTFDLGGCLRANGIDTAAPVRIPLEAVDESRPGGTDRTAVTITVCLPGCTAPANPGPQDGGQQSGGVQPGSTAGAQNGKPDLAVEATNGSDNAGNCDLDVEISNRGTAEASPSIADLAWNGAHQSVQVQNVPAGQHQHLNVSVPGACAGGTVTVALDSTHNIDEFSEDNNAGQKTF